MDFWATDPNLSVGGDGTVYLTFLKIHANPTCADVPAAVDPEGSIQLWFAPPGGRIQPALPTPVGFRAPNAVVTTKPSGLTGPLDHPKVAASPTPGIVVVYHLDLSADGDANRDLHPPGVDVRGGEPLPPGRPRDWSCPVRPFLPDRVRRGRRHVHRGEHILAEGPRSVARFSLQSNPTRWQFEEAGHVPLTGSINGLVSLPAPGSPDFANDATPAIAIGKLGASSDSIVYVATTTIDANLQRRTEIAAANTSDLSVWTAPAVIDPPPGSFVSFFPHMSLSGSSNFLDLILYDLNLRPGAPAPADPSNVPLSGSGPQFPPLPIRCGSPVHPRHLADELAPLRAHDRQPAFRSDVAASVPRFESRQ